MEKAVEVKMEKVIEVKVYKVHMMCDQCEKGEMRPTGFVYATLNLPANVHKCTECGNQETLDGNYPRIEYREFLPNE